MAHSIAHRIAEHSRAQQSTAEPTKSPWALMSASSLAWLTGGAAAAAAAGAASSILICVCECEYAYACALAYTIAY